MPVRPAVLAGILALALGASAAYTVRPGDTLSGVANRFGVSALDLARANAITDPDRLFAGRTLTVPGVAAPAVGRSHVVAAGDNLTTIARRYGVSLRSLADANRLDTRRVLRLGARLTIPGAAPSAGYPARLQQSPARLALVPHFQRWAAANAIPADLVMATTWLESGWQNQVTSSVGAYGIGQLMPATVRFVRTDLIGVPSLDPRVPEHNIRMSARYLRWLLDRAGGDVRLALAGYYQGPASVRAVGAFPGTVTYVDSVLALRSRFRA
ncbi:MAG: putative lysozyme [Acidimicrobiales bacterium]|nr:putative lysozyme [Acidimicrobiales bacterium]